jgi:predicted DCC family thiol-disulfide oxidoreductase YuxK
MAPDLSDKDIILFDGLCNLCDGMVQFVIKRDSKQRFLFSSIQSETAKKILETYNQVKIKDSLNTFVLIENGKLFTKSTAALKISKKLKGLWPLLYLFIMIPLFIRDAFYDYIAKRRYQWFGKKNECMIPSPEIKTRFF